MKCLSRDKVQQAAGLVLHDWHAEVVVLRALNFFLLEECRALATRSEYVSRIVRRRAGASRDDEDEGQPFGLVEGVRLHLYTSEAPCGDASMELVQAQQADGTPWVVRPPTEHTEHPTALLGRGSFSQVGMVRRKPARADAPISLSKSCSDKLALAQCTSVLNAVTAQLVHPRGAYLATLVLPTTQYSAVACARCFGRDGRLAVLGRDESGSSSASMWPGGYDFWPMRVRTTGTTFGYGRAVVEGRAVASPLACWWTEHGEESLVGGVLQGRKVSDGRGRSRLCRAEMWRRGKDLASQELASKSSESQQLPGKSQSISQSQSHRQELPSTSLPSQTLQSQELLDQLQKTWYHEIKTGCREQVKADVRAGLKGWERNGGDDFEYCH